MPINETVSRISNHKPDESSSATTLSAPQDAEAFVAVDCTTRLLNAAKLSLVA